MFVACYRVGKGRKKFEDGWFYDPIRRKGLQIARQQPPVESSSEQRRMILTDGREVEERLADTIESETQACREYDAESERPG